MEASSLGSVVLSMKCVYKTKYMSWHTIASANPNGVHPHKGFCADAHQQYRIKYSCYPWNNFTARDISELVSAGIINKFLTEETVNHPKYRPLKVPRRPMWTKEMSSQTI